MLLIVPMFHVLAWGMPYAAMMSGASLVMPDRFLTPEPLAELIETARPTLAGAVPTSGPALLAQLDADAAGHVRRCGTSSSAARPARRALMEGFESGTASTSRTPGG